MIEPQLAVATRNAGKIAELRRLLGSRLLRLRSLEDLGIDAELDEPGPGYAENAAAKAAAVAEATGVPALADDSGIEIHALHGWPGPLSARWMQGTDADRLRGLLDEVARRTPGAPHCRYVAVVALARPTAGTVIAHGSCEGTLVEPRGQGGFGYDPGFLSTDLGITFAEATPDQKDSVSHRARALARLAESGVLDQL